MASKNKNPYRDGSAYAAIFAAIRSAQVVTRKGLLEQGFAVADVTVVLSPRDPKQTRDGADCRGNMSAQGHLYFMEKLNKVKGEPQKFRLRWRKTPLDKHVRPPKVDKASQKSGKGKAKDKAPEAAPAEATA
jgi:hypothetical protein